MADPTFLWMNAATWTAIGTIAMAVAAGWSVRVSILLMRLQTRLNEQQIRFAELQERANFLNGALESQSNLMLRLKAEEMGKQIVWWDPNHDGPVKKAPPINQVHLQDARVQTLYTYVAPENRRYPEVPA